jgi:site-specific recombinase XerD
VCLRAFFSFCVENEWAHRNPAKLVKLDKVRDVPTFPLSDEELERILANAAECRVFILTLRYTSMRIPDAALLRDGSVKGARVTFYMVTTGVPVYLPIPEFLESDLAALRRSGGYLFLRRAHAPRYSDRYLGTASRETFARAGISGGNPDRFRDTFAVSLLEQGVPNRSLVEAARPCLHQSDRASYAPWVQSLQNRLEAEVENWDAKQLA